MAVSENNNKLAENKVLILYSLNKINKDIAEDNLFKIISSINDINYFYFGQTLSDLDQSRLVDSYTKDKDTIYRITSEGKNALSLTKDILPGIIKLKADNIFKQELSSIEEESSVVAEYTPKNENDYKIKCKIVENNETIFEVSTFAGSRDNAKKIVDNWNKNANTIFPKILDLLLNSNENFHILNTYASICTIRQAYNSMSLFIKHQNDLPKYLSKRDVYALYTDQVRPILYNNKKCIKLPLSNLVRTKKVLTTTFNDPLIREFIKELNINKIENIYFPIPKVIEDKEIKQVRIVPLYKGEYIEIEFSYKKEKVELNEGNNNTLSIDVGINNLMTLVTTNNISYIIDGKRLKSINQFYNKQKAYYQSKLVNNKYSKRLKRFDLRNKHRIDDYVNKAVNQVIKISKEEKVNTIVIGYNKGLKEKGIKNDNLTNKEKSKINQNFTRIPISRLINKIKYKCEEYSINCIVINESYTSLSSFYDNDKIDKQEKYSGKRIKRGLYLTINNIEVNADVNAALNILRKSKPKDDEDIHYLRDRGLTIPKRLQVSF